MLKGRSLEGLNEILSSFGGEEINDNSAKRQRMKTFAATALTAGLTERQKRLMTLVYVEGLSQKEAGERLNMSQSAVSNMHRRALERMKRLSKFMI